jgi:hypothetical protein
LWFLWYHFDQFVIWEISLEQFMTMGDIDGQIEDQINPHLYWQEHPASLGSLTPDMVSLRNSQTMVIINPLVRTYYTHQHGDIMTDATILILRN